MSFMNFLTLRALDHVPFITFNALAQAILTKYMPTRHDKRSIGGCNKVKDSRIVTLVVD